MLQRILEKIVYAIEVAVAVILVILTGLSLFTLILSIISVIQGGGMFGRELYVSTISIVLEVFILVELFRIALAYMNHENVIPTVMEAAIVAVARKIVIFEPKGDVLDFALGLSALMLVIATSWYLLAKSKALSRRKDLKFIGDNSTDKKSKEH